jgi:hypothetical protein
MFPEHIGRVIGGFHGNRVAGSNCLFGCLIFKSSYISDGIFLICGLCAATREDFMGFREGKNSPFELGSTSGGGVCFPTSLVAEALAKAVSKKTGNPYEY